MNYADIKLGTWYPMGGMSKVVDAFLQIARQQGAALVTDAEVTGIEVKGRKAVKVHTGKESYAFDYIVAAADYHHVDQHLLPKSSRNYTPTYWGKRTMAPSSLLFYIGVDRKIEGLSHHTLFFDRDFSQHAHEIYTQPCWPKEPLFYVCCPSVTDPSVAPEGKENLFFLMPLAPGIEDTEALREDYFHRICDRFAENTGVDIRKHIVYKRSYCVSDFVKDYHAFKGNAYGLANTLLQTAFLKPKLKNKHIDNLVYAGQLTTPGPGVPPSIISGQVAASHIIQLVN
jgi:phytoene desaturase